MQRKNDTDFFNHLNAKLNELEDAHASEQDWVDFEQRYRKHRKSYLRKRFVFWFLPATLLFAVITLLPFTKQQEKAQSNPLPVSMVETKKMSRQPDAKSLDRDDKNPDRLPTSIGRKKATPSSSESQPSSDAPAATLLQYPTPRSTPTAAGNIDGSRKRTQTSNYRNTDAKTEPTGSDESMRHIEPTTISSPDITPPSKVVPEQPELPTVAATPDMTALNVKPDSAEVNKPSTRGQVDAQAPQDTSMASGTHLQQSPEAVIASTTSPAAGKYFMELNGVAYTSHAPLQSYPSDAFYRGLGLNMGYKIGNRIHIGAGLNYATMNEVNAVILKEERHSTEIIRVDTSLKFNTSDNRIGMQIDTVTATNSYINEHNVKLNTHKQVFAIPLYVQLTAGSPRFGLNVYTGVSTLFFYETTTTLTNAGKPNEEQQSTSSRRVTLAPSAGIGLYKKVYKNLNVHSSLNYQYLIPDMYFRRHIFQLQVGLRYHF